MRKASWVKVFIFGILLTLCTNMFQTVNAYNTTTSKYYPQPTAPTHLYVIESDNMSMAEESMIASLQGLIARDKPEIYILPESNINGGADRLAYLNWLNDLRDNYSVTYDTVTSAWTLIDHFKPRINQYVLFSFQDNSLNPATNLASVNNAVIVDASIESTALSHGLTKAADATGKTEQWVYDNYWNNFRHDIAFEQSGLWQQLESNQVGWRSHATLRDYSIFSQSFMFFGQNQYPLRNTIINNLEDDSPVVGYGDYWNLGEVGFVKPLSQAGTFNVAANHSLNISTLAGVPVNNAVQNTHQPNYPDENNVHYVTLVWSDGDNPQWEMGAMSTMDTSQFSWWANTNRGTFNMGWGLSPSMMDLAPSVVKSYYDKASNGTYKDDFVAYGSGGYSYPSFYPAAERQKNAQRINDYMGRMDTGSLVVIDDSAFNNTLLWNDYTSKPNVKGMFYLDYSSYHRYNGAINWSNNKPIISARYSLWQGIQSESQIANAINAASTNVTSSDAYSMISVHAWSKTMDNVKSLINQLGPNVRVVTPEVFIQKVTKNVVHNPPVPGADKHGYLMYDDFSSGTADGWISSNGTWTEGSGQYNGVAIASSQSYSLAGNASWTNYDLQADIQLVSGPLDAGLSFRALDANNNYLLAIRGSGVQLYKQVNGVYTSLGTASISNPTNTWEHYRVSLNGSNIKVYGSPQTQGTPQTYGNTQESLIMEVNDSTFTSGKVGLRTSGGTSANFDNVKVYENASTTSGTFYDANFEYGDISNWATNDGTWSLTSGEMNGTANSGAQSYALTGDPSWKNYTLTTDVKLTSGPQDAGIAFRVTDANNLYLLAIRDSGLELYKRINGVNTSLGTYTTTNLTDSWGKFIISVNGSNITVTKDTVVLLNVTDNTFSSGKIGLRTSDGTHAIFDMVKVTPVDSTILLYDDFSGSSPAVWSSTGGTWQVEAGEYSGTANSSSQSYALTGNASWTNYTFQSDVTIKSGSAVDAGIAFRATDFNNHYLLAMQTGTSGNNVQLWKRVNGTFTLLATGATSILADTTYRYKVVVNGTSIQAYKGSSLLINTTDNTFSSGKIGLRTVGGTHTHFDNVSVTN